MPKRRTIWALALILMVGALPLLSLLLAMLFASAFGCQLDEGSVHKCVVLGLDFGGLLYPMALGAFFAVFTIPLAGLALIAWFIVWVVLLFKGRHPAPTGGHREVQSVEIRDSKDGVPKFPGPVTLTPSLKKRWILLTIAACFTVLLGAGGSIIGILAATFFGVCTVMYAIDLFPGSSSLRLDASGFEITRWFRMQQFRWNEVSDFTVWAFGGSRLVMFKARRPRPGILGKINAAFAGGRNSSLPNIYETPAGDLVQILTTWRNSALNEIKLSRPG
jgi:hypothetical protein